MMHLIHDFHIIEEEFFKLLIGNNMGLLLCLNNFLI